MSKNLNQTVYRTKLNHTNGFSFAVIKKICVKSSF